MAENEDTGVEGEGEVPKGRSESADYVVMALRNLSDAVLAYPHTDELDEVTRTLLEAKQKCHKALKGLSAKGIITWSEWNVRLVTGQLRQKLERALARNNPAEIQEVVNELRRHELSLSSLDPVPPSGHPFPAEVAMLDRLRARVGTYPKLQPLVKLLEDFVALGAKAGEEDLDALIEAMQKLEGGEAGQG